MNVSANYTAKWILRLNNNAWTSRTKVNMWDLNFLLKKPLVCYYYFNIKSMEYLNLNGDIKLALKEISAKNLVYLI
jgi:hypothetical protein